MAQLDIEDHFDDSPFTCTDERPDLLGLADFASRAAMQIHRQHSAGSSSVIALVGAWGSGKTSVINSVESILSGQDLAWKVQRFNPWMFEDGLSLQFGFFRQLASAFSKKGKGKKVRKALARLGRAVAPLGALASLGGVPAGDRLLKHASDLLDPDLSLEATRAKVESSLQEYGKPVLMVLDDLDRLDPSELLLTMKLIRLIGRISNVHYLIAYDEKTLLDVLRRTGLVGDDPGRGLQYLEKIVQVRLEIPPMREKQIGLMVGQLFESLLQRHGIAIQQEELDRVLELLTEKLGLSLSTPRTLKRYFVHVDRNIGSVLGEVDLMDFLCLVWLQVHEPAVHDLIWSQKEVLVGADFPGDMNLLMYERETERRNFLIKHWGGLLGPCNVSSDRHTAVASALSLVFSRFEDPWDTRDLPRNQNSRPLRAELPEYFDRYFYLGVPNEDISDILVRNALRQISDASPGQALLEVEKRCRDGEMRRLILSKMQELLKEVPGFSSLSLFRWFAQIWALEFRKTEKAWRTSESISKSLAAQVFPLLKQKDRLMALDFLSSLSAGLKLGGVLLVHMPPDADADDTSLRELRQRYGAHCRDLLTVADIWEIDEQDWTNLLSWWYLSPDEVAEWLRERRAAGGWELIDILCRLVPEERWHGGAAVKVFLGSLDIEIIDGVFGIADVLEHFVEEVDAAVAPISRSLAPTRENRRSIVFRALNALKYPNR